MNIGSNSLDFSCYFMLYPGFSCYSDPRFCALPVRIRSKESYKNFGAEIKGLRVK